MCSCCNFISKKQSRTIKNSEQRIWKISLLERIQKKRKNKNTANEDRYFLQSNFVGVNRLFVLVDTNHGNNAKRFNA